MFLDLHLPHYSESIFIKYAPRSHRAPFSRREVLLWEKLDENANNIIPVPVILLLYSDTVGNIDVIL